MYFEYFAPRRSGVLAEISDFDRVLKNLGVRTTGAKCLRREPARDSGGNRLGRKIFEI